MKEGNKLVTDEPFTGRRHLVKVYEKYPRVYKDSHWTFATSVGVI